jgi:hypothetical protein
MSYIEELQLIDTKAYSNGTKAYHINMLNIIMGYNKYLAVLPTLQKPVVIRN